MDNKRNQEISESTLPIFDIFANFTIWANHMCLQITAFDRVLLSITHVIEVAILTIGICYIIQILSESYVKVTEIINNRTKRLLNEQRRLNE